MSFYPYSMYKNEIIHPKAQRVDQLPESMLHVVANDDDSQKKTLNDSNDDKNTNDNSEVESKDFIDDDSDNANLRKYEKMKKEKNRYQQAMIYERLKRRAESRSSGRISRMGTQAKKSRRNKKHLNGNVKSARSDPTQPTHASNHQHHPIHVNTHLVCDNNGGSGSNLVDTGAVLQPQTSQLGTTFVGSVCKSLGLCYNATSLAIIAYYIYNDTYLLHYARGIFQNLAPSIVAPWIRNYISNLQGNNNNYNQINNTNLPTFNTRTNFPGYISIPNVRSL